MKMLVATIGALLMCHLSSTAQSPPGAATPPPNTRDVIQQKIRTELTARLSERGAACNDLQVAVASNQDSATPFKVTYRGLTNFRGSDGSVPEANGDFIMNYVGGGRWQGTLAGVQLTATVGVKDNIDLPFVNDPQVIGEWESVDFVPDIAQFDPAKRAWQGKLFLKDLTFLADGKTAKPWWTWTKGLLLHHGDQTASKYEIKEIGGVRYLFLEWKSGDVMIAGMKPHYYVLKMKN